AKASCSRNVAALKDTPAGVIQTSVIVPVDGRPRSCHFSVPCFRRITTPEGSTTSKVMEHLQPSATATSSTRVARSGTWKSTVVPSSADSVPSPFTDHFAGPLSTVKVTVSPTPSSVRARSVGKVASVSEVIVHSVGHFGAASSTGASPGGEVGRSGLALGIVLEGSYMREYLSSVDRDALHQAPRAGLAFAELGCRQGPLDPRVERILKDARPER